MFPQGMKPTIGFAASLLAVWCQIVLLATISLAPLSIGAHRLGDAPICHAQDGPPPAAPAPGQPAHDCALCAICLVHATPMAILPPTQTLPGRQIAIPVRVAVAQPRAPPIRLHAAAQPRGPPSLI
jgi:hypothetical protein